MKKYWLIFLTTIKEYSAYRLNFILWRLRIVLGVLITFFLWDAVFDKNTRFLTYDKNTMLSYILVVNFIGSFVLGTRTADIAAEINDGSIINDLLKPISFFRYWFAYDLSDKFINFVFALVEFVLIILIFKINLVSLSNFLPAILFFINGTLISFFINIMLSFVGFWTTEVWAPRFIFLNLVFFLSGSFFPLDVIPASIYKILLLTPFPYLVYFPTTILLGKIPTFWIGFFGISSLWVLTTAMVALFIWKRGNKSFSFWGR